MSSPISSQYGFVEVSSDRAGSRKDVPDKITEISAFPNLMEQIGISDDLGLMRPMFGLPGMAKAVSAENINSKVELDVEGNASSLVPDIQPVTRASELLLMLRQRYSDATDILLILKALLANASNWLLDRLLLQETLDLLEAEASEEERQAMWAGANTHALTQQYARMTRFTPQQLRRWYRVWLSWSEDDEDGFFWAMTDEAELDSLGSLFHYISRALRHDMNALRPSTQPAHLSTLQNKIFAMSRFSTLLQRVCELSPAGQSASEQAASTLADPVVHFLRTILAQPVTFLPQWRTLQCHELLNDHSRQTRFLRELRAALVELPDLFFKEQSDRARLDAKIVQELSERWQGQGTGQHDVGC